VKKKLPLHKALLWILLSVIVIVGNTFALTAAYFEYGRWRAASAAYQIKLLCQTGPQKEALKTDFLAQWLGLSCDFPTNLYQLDLEEVVSRLLQCPVIEEARLQRLPPSTLAVDYTLRTPIAYIEEGSNLAIDEKGALFPVRPFFTPKKLPYLYLGLDVGSLFPLEGEALGKKTPVVQTPEIALALEILSWLKKASNGPHFSLRRLDVAKAFASSLGQREVVLWLEEWKTTPQGGYSCSRYLRLSPSCWRQQLQRYRVLKEKLWSEEEKMEQKPCPLVTIVDLRLDQLAYVKYL
jgi:hypothetical protein